MALLTQKQKNRITAMSADGATVDDIAAAMSLETADVEAVLGHREKSVLDGFEAVEIKQRKETWSTTPLSEEKREEVRKILRDGQTLKGTAMLTGVSVSSVARIKRKMKEKEPATAATAADSEENIVQVQDNTNSAESQALKAAKAKLLAIYDTLSPEETRAWELGEVYAEVVRGCGE